MLVVFGLTLGFSSALAQNESRISGSLYSSEGEALAFATAVLYQAQDSAMTKAEYTDDEGFFQMEGIAPGDYFLVFSYVGLPSYAKDQVAVPQGEDLNLGQIIMQKSGMDLSEVVVTSTKPLIEVKADKTVFNVESSISSAGADGWEVLRKAPGVMIDNNDNLQLRGKAGVLVQIDGKTSYLSPAELANFLRSLNASDIEAIEVITNPSARYEASGNSGIINIVMKKNKGLGTNGSLTISGAYGRQYRANSSLNLNHRNSNYNLYGSVGGGHSRWENGMNLYRLQNNRIFDQRQVQIGESNPINARIGLDYFLGKNHTIGVMGNVNTIIGDQIYDSNSRTVISPQGMGAEIDSILVAGNVTRSTRVNATANLNYRFTNEEKGLELGLDVDRAYYKNDPTSVQPNVYWDAMESTKLSERHFKTQSPSEINIMSVKADLDKKVGENSRISTGIKWTGVETDNVFDFFNVFDGGEEVLDIHQSNQFVYDERVSAAYVNFNTSFWEDFSFQGGLRVEHTKSTGDLTRDPSLPMRPEDFVERDYTDLFPSASLTWQIHPMHSLNATYSRRINRPNYEQLNPFEWRLDELTFRKGSPFLNPYYSNSFEIKYLALQMINLSVGYTKTDDLITDIVEASETEPDRSFINYRNLATQNHYYMGINAPTPIKKWWNGFVNINIFKSQYIAEFPEYEFDVSTPVAVNIYAEQTFNVWDNTVFEVSGWYNSSAIWGGGWVTDPQGTLNLGVQQRLFNGKATAKLSFTDVLNTASWSSTGESVPNLVVNGSGYWDSRQVRLNFNYRFGNTQVKSARQRKTGIEAETGRIGG